MVKILVIAAGGVIALFGLIGMFNPAGLKRIAKEWTTGPKLHFVSALRFAFAAIFWLGAPASKNPTVMYVIAALALIGGVLTVALPARAITGMVGWFLAFPNSAVRFWCWFPIAVGAFIIYVVI